MQVCWASSGILIFRYMQFLLTIGSVRIRTFREPNLTVLLGPAFANLPEPALAPCGSYTLRVALSLHRASPPMKALD
jgi:hypothetical protein